MAQSITVTLILDNKGYLTGIQSSLDATNKLKSGAKNATEEMGTGFENLKGKVEGFASKLEGISSLLLTAGFVEFGRRTLEAADSVVKLSEATDVSIPRILQYREAFETSGGSADKLNMMITKLSNTIDEARLGSGKAQEELLKLGFSFKDMANMDTDQAMTKIIQKLAAMQDPIQRNALAFQIFGKAAKTIDWQGVANGTKSAADEFYAYSAAERAAAEADDKLKVAHERLTIAFAQLLNNTGVLDFIKNMNTDMSKLQKVVEYAALAFAGFIGAKTIILAVEFAVAINKITTAFEGMLVVLNILEKGTALGRILSIVTMLAAAIAGYVAIKKIDESIEEANKKSNEEAIKREKELEEARKRAAEAGGQKAGVTPYYQKELEAMKGITDQYLLQHSVLMSQQKARTALLGQGEDQIRMTTQLNQLTEHYNKLQEEFNLKEKELLAESPSAARAAKLNQLLQERNRIWDDLDYSKEGELVKNENAAITAENIRKGLLEQQIALNERLNKLQLDTAKIGLTSIEQKYKDIDNAAKMSAQSEIRAEEQRKFGANAWNEETQKGMRLSDDLRKKIEENATARAEAEKKAEQATYEAQRTFNAGWSDAFAKFKEDASNQATQAKTMFDTFTKGFEDAMVNFVKTGKLSFTDFANSLIEQFVRIQSQQLLLGIFGDGSKSSGGGILGSLFSGILGTRAGGGSVSPNSPYLVGENGPELFMPRSAGTIISNSNLNSVGGTTHVTYNINATDAASFRTMLAREPELLYAITQKGASSIPSPRF